MEKPQSSISKKFDEKQIDVNLVEWFIEQIFSIVIVFLPNAVPQDARQYNYNFEMEYLGFI